VAVTGVPIIYSVNGREFLTITSGPLGGTTGAYGAISARWGWDPRVHPRRLLTFALDADARLPPTPARAQAAPLAAPEFRVDAAKATLGESEYVHCTLCHGMAAVAGGIAPDLRASPVPLSMEEFTHVVRVGALQSRGMPQFAEMSDAQLESLRHYLRQKARADLAADSQAAPH
jgi:quinohemoprotein ethanol dehydrogenase